MNIYPKIWTLAIALLMWNCTNDYDLNVPSGPERELTAAGRYFMEISFGNESGQRYSNLRKWEQDIRIFVPDTTYPQLMEELTSIIDEINDLSSTILLRRVNSMETSNYVIYFGDAGTYVSDYESNAAGFVDDNWGYFYIYWDSFEINRGSMYVDVTRAEETECRKHLLREELTQSLGLMNDTDDYTNSIFFQSWTCTTSYAELDRKMIDYILRPELQPGMTEEEVIAVVKDWE